MPDSISYVGPSVSCPGRDEGHEALFDPWLLWCKVYYIQKQCTGNLRNYQGQSDITQRLTNYLFSQDVFNNGNLLDLDYYSNLTETICLKRCLFAFMKCNYSIFLFSCFKLFLYLYGCREVFPWNFLWLGEGEDTFPPSSKKRIAGRELFRDNLGFDDDAEQEREWVRKCCWHQEGLQWPTDNNVSLFFFIP